MAEGTTFTLKSEFADSTAITASYPDGATFDVIAALGAKGEYTATDEAELNILIACPFVEVKPAKAKAPKPPTDSEKE